MPVFQFWVIQFLTLFLLLWQVLGIWRWLQHSLYPCELTRYSYLQLPQFTTSDHVFLLFTIRKLSYSSNCLWVCQMQVVVADYLAEQSQLWINSACSKKKKKNKIWAQSFLFHKTVPFHLANTYTYTCPNRKIRPRSST